MKIKMKKSELVTKDDIWNAVVSVMGETDFPTDNEVANEAYLVFQYYSEMESGGHESLLNWWSEYIEEVGAANYLKELTAILEKIGAKSYGKIVKDYGDELWRLFQALENDEVGEEKFYEVVEIADNEYYDLGGQIGELLENYFVSIYRELIEVEE